MFNHTPSKIVAHGTIAMPEDSTLYFTDPAYADRIYEMGVEVCTMWDIKEAPFFTVDDERATRAVVVTNGEPVPPELLDRKLTGAMVYLWSVGVDTGTIGIYDTEGQMLTPEPLFTYLGDGEYPVALWGRDGQIFALAVLTDYAYFRAGWDSEDD